MNTKTNRRNFLKRSAIAGAGLALIPSLVQADNSKFNAADNIYMIGPQEGYSPHIGSLLSMMTMMRAWVIRRVENLSIVELDYQIDDQSNSIGAMLLHLAATEKYYQLNTFNDMAWGTWDDAIKKEWDIPMNLGEKGREKIKGNDISYYLDKLKEVRDITEKEFAKRDDSWIQKSEPFFQDKETNNYCKWFHVCEHESNHLGQIKFILKRLPKK